MYYKTGRALFGALVVVGVLFGGGTAVAQTRNVEQIVAWVNNDIILKSEYETRLTEIRNALSQPAPNGRGLQGAQLEQAYNDQSKKVLQELIDEALYLQQAKDMGLSAEVEILKTEERLRQERKLESLEALEKEIVAQGYTVEEFKQNIRVKYLSEQVLQHEVYHRVVVTNDEVRKYYDANVKQFDRPAGIRLREIVVSTANRGPEEIASQRKKIEEALAAIKKGDDFAVTASKSSDSQTAAEGGDLGFFSKGELSSALEDIVNKLDKGQVTDIISVPDAFMILKVDDKHAGGILPFELAQKEITNILWQHGVEPKVREFLTKLRNDGFVKTAEGYVDLGASQKTEKVSENK